MKFKKEINLMNKEFNGFDEMVEALEENEEMVECKECFDLFPKAECERAEVGYICPTCKGLRTAPTQARFVDPYDSYTQDFPEVTDYDPDSVVEYEKEPGLGDALDDLIKDEYEAIEGYEVADETIQHADIEEDEKDEILDTLDHIKEEEEEHIDELKELCPECETKDKELDEKLLHPGDELPYTPTPGYKVYYVHYDFERELGYLELPEGEDPGAAVTNYFSDSYPIEDIYADECDPSELEDLVIGDFINDPQCSLTEALTEAEPEKLEEAADDEAAAEEADVEEIPEEESPEEKSEENENEEVSDLDSAYEAALEIANEKGVGQVFGYATTEDESFVAIDLFDVDDAEAVEEDLRAVYDNVKYAFVAYPQSELEEKLIESTK
jgi:hypothetical protein